MHTRVPGHEFCCLSVAMRVSCYAYQNICSSDPMHKCIWPYAIFLIRDSVIMGHGPGCARAVAPGLINYFFISHYPLFNRYPQKINFKLNKNNS